MISPAVVRSVNTVVVTFNVFKALVAPITRVLRLALSPVTVKMFV